MQEIYCATVTDNVDPDGLNRVKVSKIGDKNAVSDWAFLLMPSASGDAGVSSIPDVGSQVLVVSVDGSGVTQAVLGHIWSNAELPPKTEENANADLNKDGKNTLRFIKSRAGSQIILDDSEDAEKIKFISSDGKTRLEFNMADNLTLLETDHDQSLNAKGDISIQAEEIIITSEKDFDVTAGTYQAAFDKNFDIKSGGDMNIKGDSISLS